MRPGHAERRGREREVFDIVAENESTLYERVGGAEGVAALTDEFYQRVFTDPLLRDFFEGVALEKLARMQARFFAAALGGPVEYRGRTIAEIHAGLGIQPRHLQRFFEHLVETVKARGVTDDDAYEIASRLGTWSDDVTGRTSGVDG